MSVPLRQRDEGSGSCARKASSSHSKTGCDDADREFAWQSEKEGRVAFRGFPTEFFVTARNENWNFVLFELAIMLKKFVTP